MKNPFESGPIKKAEPSPETSAAMESRGLPEDFEDKLESLRFQKKRSELSFGSTENELQDMTKGGNADGIREQYYLGWTDEDFGALLKRLEKDE